MPAVREKDWEEKRPCDGQKVKKNCHRKTASGFSLDRGADANL